MRRLLKIGLAAFASMSSTSLVLAQAPATEDSVMVGSAGVTRLEDDLKSTMSLVPKGATHWKSLKDLLDAFTAGVDPAKPIRVDLMAGTADDFRMWVPITNHKAFQSDNVQPIVLKPAKKLLADFHEWKGPGWVLGGYERFFPKMTTSVLATQRALVPATLTDPNPGLNTLLAKDADLALLVSNTSAGSKARRERIQKVRKDLAAKIKRLADEDENGFELRKLSHEQQFDEAERFYSESEKLGLTWTLDTAKKEAHLDLTLKALAGTSLEATIKELAAEPSAFTPVVASKDTTGFARVNHAIDAMRKAHLKQFVELIKKQSNTRIANSKTIKDAHKASYTQAANQFLDLLSGGLDMGVIDGFVQTEKAGDRQTILGALRVPDGKGLVAVFESLKGAEWKVQTNVETVGDLSVHVITVPQRDDGDFAHLFDKDGTLVVATGPNVVWYAAGERAADRLKEAAAKNATAEKPKDGVFFEVWGNMSPWMQYLLDRRARLTVDEKSLTAEDKAMRKTKEGLLKTAVEAFKPGDATLHMKLERKDNEVFGRTTLSEGMLRFGGQKMVDFATKLE